MAKAYISGLVDIDLLHVSTGPVPPQPGVPTHPIVIPEPPLGIWGGGNVPFPTPPIYIPVPPPPDSGLKPEHPIYIPVFPAHPIVIPTPPIEGGEPKPPYVWPPQIWGGSGSLPKPPLGIWGGGNVPYPTPPIYIPIVPPDSGAEPGVPTHPIYLPVEPTHPIVLPPGGDKPTPPPPMVSPPTGAPGFWGYSMFYDSMVFVPYEGAGPDAGSSGGALGRRG